MKKLSILLLVLICQVSFGQKKTSAPVKKSAAIKITWTDTIPGDFSFSEKWSYPDNVELKPDGRPGCADGGFCPQRCYRMLDEYGVILKNSITAFYSLLDTIHTPHSIQCRSSCSEFAGTDFIDSYRKSNDSVFCITATDAGTHCNLQLDLVKDNCYVASNLISIVPDGDAWYVCISGKIKVDKEYWQSGILKAEFDFQLVNEKDPKEMIFWKGKIFSRIKPLVKK
jgi:hypothetical protein